MPNLETLINRNCKLMKELPDGIEHLKNLQLVGMSHRLFEKLNPEIKGGDNTKIQHISDLCIRYC